MLYNHLITVISNQFIMTWQYLDSQLHKTFGPIQIIDWFTYTINGLLIEWFLITALELSTSSSVLQLWGAVLGRTMNLSNKIKGNALSVHYLSNRGLTQHLIIRPQQRNKHNCWSTERKGPPTYSFTTGVNS